MPYRALLRIWPWWFGTAATTRRRPKFEETLAVQRELLPAKDPQIAATLTYLGNLLATMGDLKSAASVH